MWNDSGAGAGADSDPDAGAGADADARIERALRLLLTGGVLRNTLVAEQLGLHVADLQALNVLAIAGGRLTPSALAEALHQPRSSMSRILRRLESAGFVVRRVSDADRRSVTIEAVAERIAEVTERYAPQAQRLRRVLATFDARDRSVIERFLADLVVDPSRPAGREALDGDDR